MAIKALEHNWWRQPLHKEEKTWITIALVWCLVITVFMPVWHFMADQVVSTESYKISGEQYDVLFDEFVDKYKVGEMEGIAVTEPPANSDVFMRASQFLWEPVIKLKVNQTYRIHLSSVDMNHGFSITPINMNFQAVPGYDFVITLTPTTTGEYVIQCNEFCGIGHHTMTGKIIVEA
ncbi:MAG: cytochrome C oxidase subunit II [Nitrospinota bacterium]